MFSEVPILRVLLPFIAGIASFLLFSLSIIGCSTTLVFSLIIYAFQIKLNLNRYTVGAILQLTIFLLSYLICLLNVDSSKKLNTDRIQYATVILKEETKISGEYLNVKGKVVSVLGEDLNSSTNTNIQLRIKSNNTNPSIGDKLFCKLKVTEPNEGDTPGAFNYKDYLLNKNIHYIGTVESIHTISKNNLNIFIHKAHEIRKQFNEILSIHLQGDALHLATALIYGDDDLISKDLINAFSVTGTLHVLSVSGLHVGLIYILLNYLFSFLGKIKNGNKYKSVCIVICLCAYALLTGLTPSVLRSVIMFSFIVMGKNFKQEANAFNSLFASALLLLVFNPMYLLDIGFQLSYLAVFGILFFYPRINSLLKVENYLLNKAWQTTAVSVAAQLSTLPISLYYFNQFPTYFIPANLIIIPYTTLLMYACILLICVSPIKIVALYVSKITAILFHGLFTITEQMANLPKAIINHLYLSKIDLSLMYILLIIIVSTLLLQKIKLFKAGLVCTSLLMLLMSAEYIIEKRQNHLIIYNQRNDIAQIIQGHRSVVLSTKIKPENFNHKISATQKYFHTSINNYYLLDSNNFKSNVFVSNYSFIINDTLYHFISNSENINNVDLLLPQQYIASAYSLNNSKFNTLNNTSWIIKGINIESKLKHNHYSFLFKNKSVLY